MLIVIWTHEIDNGYAEKTYRDHWEAFETREDAEAKYEEILCKRGTYTVSICGVLKSTDYEESNHDDS